MVPVLTEPHFSRGSLKSAHFLHIRIVALVLLVSTVGGGRDAQALNADEILVVANSNVAESIEIADYYMNKRAIPPSRLLSVALTIKETMSRNEYDEVLKKEVLKALEKQSSLPRIAAIVLIHGVPLKIEPPELSREENELLLRYQRKRETLTDNAGENPAKFEALQKDLLQSINKLLKGDQKAAVDSELALVKKRQYDLQGWIKNPYFLGFQGLPAEIKKDDVVLVCRLDGYDAATVYRIIDDTLQGEKEGLRGTAYFDARWPRPEGTDPPGGYQRYDLSLHRAADAVKVKMRTIIDEREELFSLNCCPEVALYCGWYSLGRYIDSFAWRKGSIGYHLASAECSTLRERESTLWCSKILEKGAAATIGPVFEPYIQGFPLPELFFSLLIEGNMSLGESYLLSLPYLSWQMVLVGDPLYQPFLQME